jgi:predicted Na+-dependent transporter
LTFAPTANAIFAAAKLGGGISLPVGQLVLTVAVLQLLPFAVGLALRKWSPELLVAIDQRDAAERRVPLAGKAAASTGPTRR